GGDQRHQPQPHRLGQRLQQRRDLGGLLGRQRLAGQRRTARRCTGRGPDQQGLPHTSIFTKAAVYGKPDDKNKKKRSSNFYLRRFPCLAVCSSLSTSTTSIRPSTSTASCSVPSRPSAGLAMPTSPSPSRRSSSSCWKTPARAAASTTSASRSPTPIRSPP